jgi:glucose/arabinose dehydrogenase
MGLSINSGVALGTLVVLGLAGWVIRRPIEAWMSGENVTAATAMEPSPATAAVTTSARVRFVTVASGFAGPVDLQFIPGSSSQAVVLEKGGRARLVDLKAERTDPGAGGTGSDLAAPVEPGADVFTVDVETESELGLLGLAFHPKYTENGLFYTNTNPKGGRLRTTITEWYWRAESSGKELATPKRLLLEIDQPYKNHDGGGVAFGPEGYLFIGMGDGGSREDPQGHGQNKMSLLGKMLRIDVDKDNPYGIPEDNPFAEATDARPEIWAYGMRNPWRFTFDAHERLIAADVGQDSWEEVDIVPRGANMGWNTREGMHCFKPKEGCSKEGMIDPVFEYGRAAGQSITGGHIYLGKLLPWLSNKYIVGDFVSGRVWALALPDDAGTPAGVEELGVFPHAFSGFGRSPSGELFALDFARGLVLQLVPM